MNIRFQNDEIKIPFQKKIYSLTYHYVTKGINIVEPSSINYIISCHVLKFLMKNIGNNFPHSHHKHKISNYLI